MTNTYFEKKSFIEDDWFLPEFEETLKLVFSYNGENHEAIVTAHEFDEDGWVYVYMVTIPDFNLSFTYDPEDGLDMYEDIIDHIEGR